MRKMLRPLAVPATLAAVSLALVACSNSSTPAPTPTPSSTMLTQAAACQQLATILTPVLGGMSILKMTPEQQQQAYQRVQTQLQAVASTVPPELQDQLKKTLAGLAVILPVATDPIASDSPTVQKKADEFLKGAENLTAACKTVGVTIGQ